MAHAQRPKAQLLQNRGGQVQKAQAVGQAGTLFAQLFGRLFLGEAAFVHQLAVTHGLFHRVQILALQVFNQGQFHGLLVAHVPDDHRHLGQTRHAGSTPAALARNDDIPGPQRLRPHRNGLQQAVFGDGSR